MLKKIMFSLIALATMVTTAMAYSYDTKLPLAGNSIAGEKLQQESLFTVYMFAHRIAAPDCKAFSITDTNVSKERVDNKWQEIWTIKACSKTATIPINFELKDDGNMYAIDPMGVRVINNQ